MSLSTAMVMSKQTVHLATLFIGQGVYQYSMHILLNQYSMHIFLLVTGNSPSLISGRRRITIEIIS